MANQQASWSVASPPWRLALYWPIRSPNTTRSKNNNWQLVQPLAANDVARTMASTSHLICVVLRGSHWLRALRAAFPFRYQKWFIGSVNTALQYTDERRGEAIFGIADHAPINGTIERFDQTALSSQRPNRDHKGLDANCLTWAAIVRAQRTKRAAHARPVFETIHSRIDGETSSLWLQLDTHCVLVACHALFIQ